MGHRDSSPTCRSCGRIDICGYPYPTMDGPGSAGPEVPPDVTKFPVLCAMAIPAARQGPFSPSGSAHWARRLVLWIIHSEYPWRLLAVRQSRDDGEPLLLLPGKVTCPRALPRCMAVPPPRGSSDDRHGR
jgi:hypothetical protein